ncbi:MAG: hypothetical protein JWM82_2853 [Myxococcales bacterium]|nr:hypothetical protein [Myxococcales bacterium]
MKMQWTGVIALSLVGIVAGVEASGCSNGSGGVSPDAPSEPDGGVESGVIVDAGLDSDEVGDGTIPCSPSDFCPTPLPGLPAPSLSGIFAASPNRVVGITDDGKILLWDGSTWSTLAMGYGKLKTVWGIDADHFLIAEEKSWSLVRVTFNGSAVDIGHEDLPYASSCAPASMSISGKSATDIYVAGYCRFLDLSTYKASYTGVLFHSTAADGGIGTDRSWSVLWADGGPTSDVVALGGVYEVSPGEAFVGGWRSISEQNPVPTTLKSPLSWDPTNPGTITFVLHVKDGTIEKEDLDPSLAMCVQSIWSSPSTDSVFMGGLCTAINVTDRLSDEPKYTTVAHRARLADGGAEWTPVVREAYGVFFDLPAMLLGFGDADVYAAGAYVMHWDGSKFQLVDTAINNTPLVGRVRGLHGISPRDLWMAGDRFALHRKQ